ncbi:hypothetical protein Btru_070851 [Bulinus truncatus]|nr:hypothetical protein Btru_070851 [Bulinus truncatus]
MSSYKYTQLAGDSERAPILNDPIGVDGFNDASPAEIPIDDHLSSDAGHRASRDNVKYTALAHTGVREHADNDPEEGRVEYEVYESYVRMGLVTNKRKPCPKLHVIICGLLMASVILVAFTLIYVFVILPAHKGNIVFSDGKDHQDDLQRMKLLGENVVFTSCGLVRGFPEDGAVVFRGIPYSIPPKGDRRWRPPEARSKESGSCWHVVFNASHYGPMCVQPKFDDVNSIVGSEDCLYLNVWTPSLTPKELLPVLVWIHSGDLVYGSGNMAGMSPTPAVAVSTKAVYVSFNYRLGAFGFLSLDQLKTGADKSAGNYGFMDQQMALKWVRDNIGSFGGNKNLVTIFGHGSGATSVEALLLSPGSIGLFHKAWMTSPVAILNKTIAEACKDNRQFLTNSGCDSAECLRSLSPEKVSRSSPWPLEPQWTVDQIFQIPQKGQLRNDLAIFDGHFVHQTSMTNGPQGPVVPIIFGTTYFDLSSLRSEQSLLNLTWEEYDSTLNTYRDILDERSLQDVRALYSHNITVSYSGPSHFPPLPSAQLAHLLSDIKTVCPIKLLADSFYRLYSNSAPLYLYVGEIFPTHTMLLSRDEANMFVGWDASAFFGNFHDFDFLEGQGDVNFGNVLREEVMNFITSGSPGALRWKTANVTTGIISTDISVAPAPDNYFNKCDFWRKLGHFKYSWLR